MPVVHCPTCGVAFDAELSPAMPFCSPRCRAIDLGRWLNEQQGLPVEPEDREDEEDNDALSLR
jgi:endogenous inhibitor of DNA gyrase (YacG/DUF329 family)